MPDTSQPAASVPNRPISPGMVILYVADVTRSVAFYSGLMGRTPVESAPSFAMFPLDSGMMLGLWRRDGVVPSAGPAGGGELAITVEADDEVLAMHTAWSTKDIEILQSPCRMDFGFTFTAADPDGHRLRVLAAPTS